MLHGHVMEDMYIYHIQNLKSNKIFAEKSERFRKGKIMKKTKRISMFLISLSFMMIFSTNVCASSKISKGKVKALYHTFLSKKETQIRNTYPQTITLENAYFKAVDIDGNGIKELIIKEKSNSMGVCWPVAYIFTIKNKKVVYAGSTCIKQDYSNGVEISKKYKSIYSCYPVASYTPTYFYTLKKGRLRSKKFFYAQYGYENEEHETWCKSAGYFINKRKVSEGKYNKEYQKYMKSLKRYLLVENTAGNRKKELK